MSSDITDFLHDILDNVEKAEQFTAGITLTQFTQDEKSAYATIRALEIIKFWLICLAHPCRHKIFPSFD